MTTNTNQSGLQELPPFPICARHHEPIKGVCLFHGNCADRLICRACRKIHDNNHLNYYEGLEDIFNGNLVNETLKDFEGMVGKIETNDLTAKQTSQFLISQIDSQFNEIQGYIIQKLNHVRSIIFDDINQKFKNNANAKQQIILGMKDLQKSYDVASKSGFSPQFVILNVIHSLCNAQLLKDRISKDPELNAQQSGELTTGYMNAVTSGSLYQHVKVSFDRICEDITESFLIKGRNELAFQEANRSLHKLGQIGQDYSSNLNYNTGATNLFPNLNSTQLDFHSFSNMLNNAAENANARTSVPKGVLKNPQTSNFGTYSFTNLTEQYGGNQGYLPRSQNQSNYDSRENSRGFGNENEYGYFGNRNIGQFGNKTVSFQQQQQPEEKTQLDFSSLVRNLSSSDLIKAQSELKLKVPQNSFVAYDQSRNQPIQTENLMDRIQVHAVLETPNILSFGRQDDQNTQGTQNIQEESNYMAEEKPERNIIEEPTLLDPPYEPGQPDTIHYKELNQGESNQMQEEWQQQGEGMNLEQEEVEIPKPASKKHTPLNILEIFQRVQEEHKTSTGRVDTTEEETKQADQRRRSNTPMQQENTRERSQGRNERGGDMLNYIDHFYTQHRQIRPGAMALNSVKNHLITGGQDGKIEVWGLGAKKCLYKFPAHNGEVYRVFYIEEKDMIASCGLDKSVGVWDCKNDYKNVKMYTKHEGPVYAIEYISHMNMMASGGEDGRVRIWGIENQKDELPQNIPNSQIKSFCYLRISKRLVIGLDRGSVRILNLAVTPKRLGFPEQAHGTINNVSNIVCLEDKNRLFTSSDDGYVKMWKINQDKLELVLQVGQNGYGVSSFMLSLKQNLIISNHNDGRIRLFKGSNGDKLGEKYDSSFGGGLVLFKETNRMVTAKEGEVKLWQINK